MSIGLRDIWKQVNDPNRQTHCLESPFIGFLRDTPLTEQHGNKSRADSRLTGNYYHCCCCAGRICGPGQG